MNESLFIGMTQQLHTFDERKFKMINKSDKEDEQSVRKQWELGDEWELIGYEPPKLTFRKYRNGN